MDPRKLELLFHRAELLLARAKAPWLDSNVWRLIADKCDSPRFLAGTLMHCSRYIRDAAEPIIKPFRDVYLSHIDRKIAKKSAMMLRECIMALRFRRAGEQTPFEFGVWRAVFDLEVEEPPVDPGFVTRITYPLGPDVVRCIIRATHDEHPCIVTAPLAPLGHDGVVLATFVILWADNTVLWMQHSDAPDTDPDAPSSFAVLHYELRSEVGVLDPAVARASMQTLSEDSAVMQDNAVNHVARLLLRIMAVRKRLQRNRDVCREAAQRTAAA
jgi:hypothetical protein